VGRRQFTDEGGKSGPDETKGSLSKIRFLSKGVPYDKLRKKPGKKGW